MAPKGDIRFEQSGTLASVPIHFHFKSGARELETDGTADFVKRGDSWYFASFDFLKTPGVLILVLVGCVTVGISYATVILMLKHRLEKASQFNGANLIKIFIPLFWPQLFSLATASRPPCPPKQPEAANAPTHSTENQPCH